MIKLLGCRLASLLSKRTTYLPLRAKIPAYFFSAGKKCVNKPDQLCKNPDDSCQDNPMKKCDFHGGCQNKDNTHQHGCGHNHQHQHKQHGCGLKHQHKQNGCGHQHKQHGCGHQQQHKCGHKQHGCGHKHQHSPQSQQVLYAKQSVMGKDYDVFSAEGSINIKESEGQGSGQQRQQGFFLIQFTCNKCNNRLARLMSKHSYSKGVVLIRCSSCQGVHLIADNLGWFTDEKTNVEQMAKEKGESVTKVPNEEILKLVQSMLLREKEHSEQGKP